MMRIRSTAALLVAVLAVPASLDAQTSPDTGSLTGYVLDPFGGGVPDHGLQVDEITNNRQSARPDNRHTTRTDNAGYFDFKDLPAGTYRVLGGGDGPLRPVEVTIKPGERVDRNLEMSVFTVPMSVTVCGECAEPMKGLQFVMRDMDEEHYRGWHVLPALFLQPEQLTITYPAPLRATGVDGTVEIEGWVGTDGKPTRLQVLSDTDPELNDAVITALRTSSWTPARVGGVPVEGPIKVQIAFVVQPEPTTHQTDP